MMIKRNAMSRTFSVCWEVIEDPNSEDRLISAFELLLSDNPEPAFDRIPEHRQDNSKG
jgi:hypothetical protein